MQFGKPAVMGILNVTPDSFYDGGKYRTDREILARAEQILVEGGDMIDIGVVSTRPGAVLLKPDDESELLKRVVPLVRKEFGDAIVSVDTCFSAPARVAVENGADIVNDVSGGAFDEAIFDTVASLGVPYVLMHNRTTPDRMSQAAVYGDVVGDVVLELSGKLDKLHRLGVCDVIIDLGFGFSKNMEHNYRLMASLSRIRVLFPNEPLLVAVSRKSMVYKLLDVSPDDALTGTTVLHTHALLSGAQMLRVHDVRAACQAVTVASEIMKYVE